MTRACVEWQLGVAAHDLRPVDHVAALRPRSVFVLTGAADERARPAAARALAARARGAELWLVPGAGHEDVWHQGGDAYVRRVVDFLRSRLAP